MTNSIYTIKSPLTSSDTSLPKLVRDALLDGVVNNGVRFIADFGFGYSYPGGPLSGRAAPGAPLNGALVADVSETADGSMVVGSGQTVNYAGGGMDFSALTARGSSLVLPAAVSADLWTAYGGASQQYLLCAYLKLPVLADWVDGTLGSVLTFSPPGGHPEIAGIHLTGSGDVISAIRELTNSTTETFSLPVMDAADYGQFAQLAFWRNAAGRGLTLKTARARVTVTAAIGAQNTNDFSATTGKAGADGGYWASSLAGANGFKNYRLYRVFVENLARSGRAPLTVLDADWARVVARGVFS